MYCNLMYFFIDFNMDYMTLVLYVLLFSFQIHPQIQLHPDETWHAENVSYFIIGKRAHLHPQNNLMSTLHTGGHYFQVCLLVG